jgi:hypothetical protein
VRDHYCLAGSRSAAVLMIRVLFLTY